jgi:hypothetical protein
MSDIRRKYVPPSLALTAFNCPHCGALAKQQWFTAHADQKAKDELPLNITSGKVENLDLADVEGETERNEIKDWARRVASGIPFLEVEGGHRRYAIYNVSVSQCFNCDQIGLWIHSRLMWPIVGSAPLPNSDLPEDVRLDYEEAGAILNLSPRGAAALLRLAIQKLCRALGEKGRNIDEDIAALVTKGLDIRVQQALDIVRVIGNHAVHPGKIDLKDDRATAEKLFGLVNLIAEVMISQPKHVSEMFSGLPEGARQAIERRDKKP